MKKFIRNWKDEVYGENKFFLYRQNNSGGCFDQDENVDVNVIIEAKSEYESNRLQKTLAFTSMEYIKEWTALVVEIDGMNFQIIMIQLKKHLNILTLCGVERLLT